MPHGDLQFREPPTIAAPGGHCGKCGYALSEDPMPQCPQCGAPTSTTPPEAGWATIDTCPVCRYDLRGSRHPKCPECGTDVQEHTDVADIEAWQRMSARRKARCPRCRHALHGTPSPRCPQCGLAFRAVRDRTSAWRIARMSLATGVVPLTVYVAWVVLTGDLWDRVDLIPAEGIGPIMMPAITSTLALLDAAGLLWLVHGRARFCVRSEPVQFAVAGASVALGLLPGAAAVVMGLWWALAVR